jgi:hypothetical protein
MEEKPSLAMLLTPCRSGRHLWFMEEDARKCCTGLKRVLVKSEAEADTWLYLFGFGYKWVSADDPRPEWDG